MAKKYKFTGYEKLEDMAREYITDKNDKLLHTSFQRGWVTTVEKGPKKSPENTTVKIEGDDENEYTFKGATAYDAISCGTASLMKYLAVEFFAEKDTKEVAAIFMQYTSHCALLRADGYLCKLKLKQYSTRLTNAGDRAEKCLGGDLGAMTASDICVQSSYLTMAGWIFLRWLFSLVL